MKKLAAFIAILHCGFAWGLPVGNPSQASLFYDENKCGWGCPIYDEGSCEWRYSNPTFLDQFNIHFGFYGDYVFNRHLEFTEMNGVPAGDGTFLNTVTLSTNAGYLALNYCDLVEVFTTLGASHLEAFATMPAGMGGGIDSNVSSRFSWSVGARATLFEYGCTTLGIEGQYFRYDSDLQDVVLSGTVTLAQEMEVDYREWQVGLGISHSIGPFVPYIAVKWAQARIDAIGGADMGGTTLIDNAKDWGYAVGISILDCGPAVFTVEGRWGDEKALYVNGLLEF